MLSRFLPPTRRQVRVAVGVLWLIDAGLQAQPHLFTADWWRGDLAESVMDQPAPIYHSIYWVINLIAPHSVAFNSLFVAIQLLLGLCLVLGRWERAAILASIPYALGVWYVGEGFANLTSGFGLLEAEAPSSVLFYPLLCLLAWPGPERRRGVIRSGSALVEQARESLRAAALTTAQSLDDGPPGRDGRLHLDHRQIALRSGLAAWVVVWVGGALLHLPWRFPPFRVIMATMEESSAGQPHWMGDIAHSIATLARTHPIALPAALGVAEALVGLGVLAPRTRRLALSLGLALSTLFWVTVQFFGQIFGGDETDPGTAPLVIILALALWPAWSSSKKPTPKPIAGRATDTSRPVATTPGVATTPAIAS